MSAVEPAQRYTRANPCPICLGWSAAPQGAGIRCWGMRSSDGDFAHCTRPERAGRMSPHLGNGGGETYAHKLKGSCLCGVTHGEADRAPQVRAIGEAAAAKIVATYDYTDEFGDLVYQVVRKHPKAFLQRRPDGAGGWAWGLAGTAPLLYRLPEVIAAVLACDPVYIAEGEKDVDALREAGAVATCNSGGAGKFPAAMAEHLRGADVVIVQDKDDPGRAHAKDVAAKLKAVAKSVRIVEARTGKDAADHLASGHGLADFVQVWPAPEKQANPLDWVRTILRGSTQVSEPLRRVDFRAAKNKARLPTWPSGLHRSIDLQTFSGVTILAGRPSAGKSFVSIASSIDAVLYGDWQVRYITAEMGDKQIADRVSRYCMEVSGGRTDEPPAGWRMIESDFGSDLEPLIELLCEDATADKTLVVLDSVSSFVDNSGQLSVDDIHGITLLKRIVMWANNVKRKTDGHVSFLLLSELNAQGMTKGRFGDHKADLVVAMESQQENESMKEIRVVKGWEQKAGPVGTYSLDWRTSRLTLMEGGINGD